MPKWEVVRTDSFLKDLKKFRRVNELLVELDKKIQKIESILKLWIIVRMFIK